MPEGPAETCLSMGTGSAFSKKSVFVSMPSNPRRDEKTREGEELKRNCWRLSAGWLLGWRSGWPSPRACWLAGGLLAGSKIENAGLQLAIGNIALSVLGMLVLAIFEPS